MTTTTSFHIQTNLDIDKCGVFNVPWYDLDSVNAMATEEAAREVMNKGLRICYYSINHKWYYTLKPENLRIVKRITQEEVV